MQPTKALSCWQCGTVLSAAGGRCPACGVEQHHAPAVNVLPQVAPIAAPLGQARPPRRAPAAKGAPKALPWIVLGVGLLGIGLGAVLLGPRTKEPTGPDRTALSTASARPASETAVDPNDLGIVNPAAVDPSELLGRAKTRALAWSRDALLVSLRAEPVVGGKVDLTSGGSVEYSFGKPTGEGFGPGSRVAGKRLRIRVGKAGTEVAEAGAGPGRAALEPNCPLDEAVQKVRAAGLPAGTPLVVSYDVSDKHQKAVWRVSAAGGNAQNRTLDGWTCAILVR